MDKTQKVFQSVLFNISKLLQVNQDPEEVFTNVLKLTRQIIPFDRSTLFLYDSRTDRLEMITTLGGPINLAELFSFGKGQGLSGWTAKAKRPIILGNLYPNEPDSEEEIIHSFLSVPLLLNDSLVGVLNCGHFDREAYKDSDLINLQIIASQIAGIIEHARATIEVMEKNIELERVNKELQKAQDKLIESEKLATVGQMAVRLSHEINNPLTIINGTLRLIEEEFEEIKSGDDRTDIKGQFQVIDEQVTRIESVVKRLFNIKRVMTESYSADARMLILDSPQDQK